jgi:hypothetical protein
MFIFTGKTGMHSPLGGRILHCIILFGLIISFIETTISRTSCEYSCVTNELKKALEKGYVVQRIYEVWYFDEAEQYDPKTKTGGLCIDYVNTLLL